MSSATMQIHLSIFPLDWSGRKYIFFSEARNLISWMLSRDPDARPTLQQIRCHPWVSKPRHHWRGRMPAAYHQPRMCWKGWNLWKCFLEIRALFFYLRACSWRKHISRNNKTGSKPSVKWDQLYSSLFSGAKL